jgi:hypothetical protein
MELVSFFLTLEDEKMNDSYNSDEYGPKPSKWARFFFTTVILLGYSFCESLLWFLAIFQFLFITIKGRRNKYIQDFAELLVSWTSQAIRYCLSSEEKAPFPFSKWPNFTK